MKFCAVAASGHVRVGVLRGSEIALLPDSFGDLVSIVAGGSGALLEVEDTLRKGACDLVPQRGLLAPIQRFRRDILCTGWNYWDHFDEGRSHRPDVERPIAPTYFTKSADTVIAPDADIGIDPALSVKWDYEAELAVVIGKTGRSIPRGCAMDHVFGYTLANDVSQRELQRRHGGQWFKGKSIDATMPLGPFIATPDEINLQQTRIRCEVNGEVRQDALTSQMAFSIPELIAELSLGMTLHAGDVLITGTPSGVGNSRKPPIYLAPGDTVVISGTGLGEQRNRIVAVDLRGNSDVALENATGAKI
jgi:2-keto-4-pentenoate hydratase/2-oxohepta-3-ene-1,7-dioic acid hydratase in catechol pathway